MFGNFKYKLLCLCCLTFFVGLLSWNIYQPIVALQEEKPKFLKTRINKPNEKVLELLEKDKLECVPVDGSLKYRFIQIKRQELDLNDNEKSLIDKLSKLMEQILLIEKKIENKKKTDIEKRIKLEKKLNQLKDKYNKLLKEQFSIDDSIDLLYREVCRD